MGIGYTTAGRRPLFQSSERFTLIGVSTAGTVLASRGVFHLGSTSTGGPVECTLNPPVAGDVVKIICRTIGSTGSPFYIDATSSGYTFDGTNDRISLSTGDAIEMIGYTSSRYLILSTYNSTGLTLSTST